MAKTELRWPDEFKRLLLAYRVDGPAELSRAMDRSKSTVQSWAARGVPLDALVQAKSETGRSLDWLVSGDASKDGAIESDSYDLSQSEAKNHSYALGVQIASNSAIDLESHAALGRPQQLNGGYAMTHMSTPHEAREPSGPLETARRQALLADYLACDEEGQRAIEHLTRVMAGARSPEKEAQPAPVLTVKDLRQAQESLNAEVSRIALNLNLVDSDRLRQVSVGIDHLLEHGEWPALNPGPRPAFVRAPIGAQSATSGTGGHQPETHGSRERGAATNKGLHTARSGGAGGPRR